MTTESNTDQEATTDSGHLQRGVMHELSPDEFKRQYMQEPVRATPCPYCENALSERDSPRKGIISYCKKCGWKSA